MKYGFQAPQYGVARNQLAYTDAGAAIGGTLEPGPDPAGGPRIVVKRRRPVDNPEMPPAEQPSGLAAPKVPKVYRVDGRTGAAPVASSGADAVVLVIEGPEAPRLRRRRDPLRAPTLVQHVVFEPALASAEPYSLRAQDEAPSVDAKALRRALDVLDATLLAAARAQQAFRALDEHLTSLGLPNKFS